MRGLASAPVRAALLALFECLALQEQAGALAVPGGGGDEDDDDEDDCGVDYGDGDGGSAGGKKGGEPSAGEPAGELVGRGFGLPSGEGRAEEAAVVRRTVGRPPPCIYLPCPCAPARPPCARA